MIKEVRQGMLFTVVAMVLLGGAYHVVLWGIGRAVFPEQAEGSLVQRDDGSVVGSRLIAQSFTRPEYFHPRPSAVDYNAAATGGSNHAPTNADHLGAVRQRLDQVMATEGVVAARVPSEMVTTSGAGLDPHIPPAGADVQAARVARARRLDVAAVRALIAAHVEAPTFGLLGHARVNVLELNLALDDRFGAVSPPRVSTTGPR